MNIISPTKTVLVGERQSGVSGWNVVMIGRVSWKSTGDCVRNANKYSQIHINKYMMIMTISFTKLLFRNGEGSGKVIRNRYPGPDHQQNLISSSDWKAQS